MYVEVDKAMNGQIVHLRGVARQNQLIFILGPQSSRAGPDPTTGVLLSRQRFGPRHSGKEAMSR